MTYAFFIRPLAILALVVGLFATPAAHAATNGTTCSNFPNVQWWQLTHDKVRATVKETFRGDWPAYITKWTDQRDRLIDIQGRNSAIVVPKYGYVLKGAQLSEYIRRIDLRIAVTRCLSEEAATIAQNGSSSVLGGGRGVDALDPRP